MKTKGTEIVIPPGWDAFGDVRAAISTAEGTDDGGIFRMNLSEKVGDDAARVRRNRDLFLERIGCRGWGLAIPDQVHSSTILTVDEPGRFPVSDALVTMKPGLLVGVTIADCVPILLLDRHAGVVAAVHAGWRGTAARITANTVDHMGKKYGVRPENLLAFIGHSAGACCYEVGPDVARQLPPRAVVSENGRTTLDLKRENAFQLAEMGVPEANIGISAECTICTPRLHSYRRDGNRSGRMMAVIGLVPEGE